MKNGSINIIIPYQHNFISDFTYFISPHEFKKWDKLLGGIGGMGENEGIRRYGSIKTQK